MNQLSGTRRHRLFTRLHGRKHTSTFARRNIYFVYEPNPVPAFKTSGTSVRRGRPAFLNPHPAPLRIHGLPWQLSLHGAPPPPGRDAELQQAFVVIKTECQAEEGWQWIKASFACESTCISWESHRFHVPRRLCLRFKWLCFVLVNVPPQHQIQAAARGGLSSLIWPSSHLIGCKAWRRRTLCRPR